MQKPKLIDVATRAGVSKSTASQFLNGRYEYMSDKTRRKLEAAVKELGFVPNHMARSLKTKKSHTIGVVVNTIAGATTSVVIRGIDDYLKAQGYNVMIYNTDYQTDQEKRALEGLEAVNADGLIITSSGNITDILNDEQKLGMPVVHLHRALEGLKVTNILSDFEAGSYEATKYLIGLGHRRIAVITRPYNHIPSRVLRVQGYHNALEEVGIPSDPSLVRTLDYAESLDNIIDSLLKLPDPPTAVFTQFTRITINTLTYCQSRGIRIPEDLSLIAFDDLPMAPLFMTPITVVNQSAYQMGVEAAKVLLQKIAHPEEAQEDVVLPCELIVRNSCRSLPEHKKSTNQGNND